MSAPATVHVPVGLVPRLRELALRSLARMYRPDEGLFAFRIRRHDAALVLEGSSLRYTAIALIGLSGEDEGAQASVLRGIGARAAGQRLVGALGTVSNLGDVALGLWAACAVGQVERRSVVERVLALRPDEVAQPTVEVAWTLAALCADLDAPVGTLRERLARRLIGAFDPRSGMFPHVIGARSGGLRGHVCCFADLVYPIHALARYAELFGDAEAREVALRCGQAMCQRHGAQGQWWWHYDVRTGDVVERYPVYAIHQDAMAPMALFALERASALDFSASIASGLTWLARAPELGGGSLIDERADLVWRKVARREPRKLSRFVQAAASRLHPALRAPGLDVVFPPGAIDYEDRPYHLGWLLHAWPAERAAAWSSEHAAR